MKNIKGFILGVIFTVIVVAFAATAYASFLGQSISIDERIKIYFLEKELTLKDVNDNAVEAFIYNGTTYVPIRAISETFGKSVNWDGKNNAAYIDEPLDSDLRLNISEIIVKHWGFGGVVNQQTLEFRKNCLTSYYYDVWENESSDYSTYISSAKQNVFFEAVKHNSMLSWNSSDWKYEGIEANRIDDGPLYDIIIEFDDGTRWEIHKYTQFPENWEQMREAFLVLTGKDILLYDPNDWQY